MSDYDYESLDYDDRASSRHKSRSRSRSRDRSRSPRSQASSRSAYSRSRSHSGSRSGSQVSSNDRSRSRAASSSRSRSRSGGRSGSRTRSPSPRSSIDCDDAIFEAKQRGYYQLEVSSRDRGHMLSFRHDGKCGGVRINVYYTRGTVVTCLDHPQQGKTQLFRRNMTLGDLREIFDDPRTHTDKGYHRIPNSGFKYNEDRAVADPSTMRLFQDEDTMDFFDDVTKEDIDSISVGHNCFIILYTDGQTAWSSGLPKHLDNKLRGRQSWLPRPEVIALGLRSPNSYYVQFADGKSSWCDLPDELETAIQENDEAVDLITIGDDDNFYVRFKDGSENWRLPSDLSNLLNGRNGTRRGGNPNLAEVKRISVSEEGEWVVGFSDGQWKWSSSYSGNILDTDVTDEMRSCDKIYEFQMGPNSDFVFLYKEN